MVAIHQKTQIGPEQRNAKIHLSKHQLYCPSEPPTAVKIHPTGFVAAGSSERCLTPAIP
jgi:hypothetical protein